MSLITIEKLSRTLLLFMLLLPVATLLLTSIHEQHQLQEHQIKEEEEILLQNQQHAATAAGTAVRHLLLHRNPVNTIVDTLGHGQTDAPLSRRLKRQLPFEQKFSLPAVPLPTPPPFPTGRHNFDLNAFASLDNNNNNKEEDDRNLARYAQDNTFAGGNKAVSNACGGTLKSRYGIIQTPNFPNKFQTPIECVWIIDASELPSIPTASSSTSSTSSTSSSSSSSLANASIVVYLTQLYVLGGIKFTEYMYYSNDFKVPAHRVFTLNEDDVTQVTWVQFNSQYLEIRFTMQTLDGTHLRALDRLLDVYGFNITYEVQNQVKSYQCNTLQCRFLGHCYAAADFSSYGCSCFAGFSGIDCGHGPLCEDPYTNVCQNGGTCKHIGDAAITCHCPASFKGTKCEIPEINEKTRGCTIDSNASNCHKECTFEPSSAREVSKNNRNMVLCFVRERRHFFFGLRKSKIL